MYSFLNVGFGPPLKPGFGPGILLPLITYNMRPLALTDTEFGYQPVGIRPATFRFRRFTTATAFSPPSVTYSHRSSGLNASELGFAPLYGLPSRRREIVAITCSAS